MKDWEVFTAVVEQESVNRAAALLSLSQPAVSRKIMVLEDELGLRLFDREGKRLRLTRAGRMYYEYAVKMRALDLELHEAFGRLREGTAPLTLTIGASLTTLQTTLPDLITAYAEAFPETDIKAITGKTHEIIGLVKEKKVDIGLIASRADHSGVLCIPLFDDHLALVLSSGHPLAEQEAVAMKELNGLPMILFARGTWYRTLVDELFDASGLLPDVRMEIDSFEAILRLVSSLKAATLLPMSYLRRQLFESGELVLRQLPELVKAKRTTSLIFTAEAAGSAHLQLFVEKAEEHLSRRKEGAASST
ncbi:LysR family transcriptional regulator [Gorillibacterium timonense]|uniref:LysR family transcriptional regulator n=1 Tax=Gorillibacterium timonense TaxID=1689269 RepID=UPI00071D12E3|nr:LysR family transcriptional regulator [Gorillibacterium timonense]